MNCKYTWEYYHIVYDDVVDIIGTSTGFQFRTSGKYYGEFYAPYLERFGQPPPKLVVKDWIQKAYERTKEDFPEETARRQV